MVDAEPAQLSVVILVTLLARSYRMRFFTNDTITTTDWISPPRDGNPRPDSHETINLLDHGMDYHGVHNSLLTCVGTGCGL